MSRRWFVKSAVASGVALGTFAPRVAVAQSSPGLSPDTIVLCKDGCGCATAVTAATTYQDPVAVNSDLLVWDNGTRDQGGMENVGQLIQAICDKFDAKGSQITVWITGHGAAGDMSVGAGTGATMVTGAGSDTDTGLNSTNAAWFADQIKDKVTRITLFGCKVGANQNFLNTMSTGDNDVLEVKAYDGVVCTNSTISVHRPSTGATLKCSNP